MSSRRHIAEAGLGGPYTTFDAFIRVATNNCNHWVTHSQGYPTVEDAQGVVDTLRDLSGDGVRWHINTDGVARYCIKALVYNEPVATMFGVV